MCTSYTYTDICILASGLSGSFGNFKCLIPTPGLTSEYPTCSVSVCVRIHTRTLTMTYTLTLVMNRENTGKTPIDPSVKIIPHARNKCPAETG